METRIGGLFAGLVLGGSSAVGGGAVVGAGLYAAGYLVARLGRRTAAAAASERCRPGPRTQACVSGLFMQPSGIESTLFQESLRL